MMPDAAPPGRTSLMLELPCDVEDDIFMDTAMEMGMAAAEAVLARRPATADIAEMRSERGLVEA